MTNRFTGLIAFLLIIFTVWLSFNFDQPDFDPDTNGNLTNFSTSRAFEHVEAIAKEPHYVGSPAHSKARNYIVDQLQKMGLEVQTQEAYHLNKHGVLVKPQNILARIDGSRNGDALVLMTHYDSAMHSSYGASDAGSGVATILEGIRAFLEKNPEHQNDIILLFTDAEELGLNGAGLFIKDHPWAKDAKLALNFEARGSGGNPFMLLETNGKNAKLIEAFKEADVDFPVTNSLAYSIYKMLPNDTDLTVLREEGDINGYNFAFIDDHFDYHTANDLPKNLDKETLAHQGSYLMPLLDYFSNRDIENLSSDRDLIYFSLPFGEFVTYPFNWISPMLILAIILFIALVIYGIRRESLNIIGIFKGFIPVILSLIVSGLLVWGFWQFCLFIYPEYSEMEHGFTYNGYWYISSCIFLALAVCFMIYHLLRRSLRTASVFIAPLTLWLIICGLISVYLKGAAYFIIPVYFGLLQLFVMIRQEKPNRILMVVLSSPAIFILLPFIWSLPVALGLKMLFVTAILVSLLFFLFLPLFGYFRRLKSFAVLCFLIFNVLIFVAHYYSDFSIDKPKPNSLVYLQDLDENTSTWYSYDSMVDDWTSEYFGENPVKTSHTESNFSSKYGSGFTFKAEAPYINIPEPKIIIENRGLDSLSNQNYSLKIAPNRVINRMEIYETKDVDFKEFKVNGLEAGEVYLGENAFHMFKRRWKERLLTYYASNQDTLRIDFSVEKGDLPEFVIYESAYDLIGNKDLNVKERPEGMIPRPFILNDVTILKKTIRIKN
ncbi:M20/M25/M40 family metallo-hydrolase [Gramella sp. MAR_2010_147]|uniref:M20/M25/M40 family metallo-hydrolase n=1 Tax=Gramella sp. MAR_2010_147 TaxID=1250205 RepID=UPI00087AE77D|nr:M20/M25/M40 family metallo-hydrolase [Gramella sp. MAR_2010_147]SDS45270.1 Zn-dependent amino-or carboxypeptidase, M28 family [Gramella sp. MAR_2010_147]